MQQLLSWVWHSNITSIRPIGNWLVLDKDISLLTMAKTISKKSSVKDSAANLLGNPSPEDKTFVLDPSIHFYDIEDRDETEKV